MKRLFAFSYRVDHSGRSCKRGRSSASRPLRRSHRRPTFPPRPRLQLGGRLCRYQWWLGTGGTVDTTMTPNTAFPAGVSSNANDNGGIVGGTLGAKFQTGAFVFGVEGDWDYSGINTGTTSNVCNFSGTCQTGNNWLSTLRGRFGWAVDRVLFYGTAGGAFADVQTTFNGVSTTHTQAGWTAGLGAEWAFAQNWTAKVEYLYVNVGNGTANCSTGACLAANGGAVIPVSVGA